jgi:hypothetical protein
MLRHHSTRSDEAKFTKVVPTNDGRIGTNGGPFPDMRCSVLPPSVNGASRIGNVRENAAGPQKDIVVAGNTFVDAHVILDLHVVPQPHSWGYHDILAQVAFFAEHGTAHDVGEMPNLGSFTDGAAVIDDGGFVSEKSGFHFL